MNVDYLIIGQGMAGTMLSYFLLQKNKKILVIDESSPSSSSNVSAGAFNPVTGRRMVKTWKADQLLPFAERSYHEMEEMLHLTFHHKKDIFKVFTSIKEQNDLIAKSASPEMANYLSMEADDNWITPFVNSPLGGAKVTGSGHIEIATLIEKFREYLQNESLLVEEKFSFEDLIVSKEQVAWKDHKAQRILFCEGHHAVTNPYFKWLPFVLTKGELLTIRIPGFPEDRIIKCGISILPMGDGLFRAGATYNWDQLDETPSEEGRQDLVEKLDKALKVPYEIVAHKAGIRPTVRDRRPFVGMHPVHSNVGIFNGIGTKAIMLSPYFSHQFVESLEEDKTLDKEVSIKRYYSYFYDRK